MYLACRRHKLERDLNCVWRTAFPAPTTAPADKLCDSVFRLYEEGKFPTLLDENCPHVFPSRSAFYKRQKQKVAELAEQMDATGETDGALPRDDYRYLLNLIKVS